MKKLLLLLLLLLGLMDIASADNNVETNILKLKALNACEKCNLQGTNLSGADLYEAIIDSATLCNTVTPWGIENSGC